MNWGWINPKVGKDTEKQRKLVMGKKDTQRYNNEINPQRQSSVVSND